MRCLFAAWLLASWCFAVAPHSLADDNMVKWISSNGGFVDFTIGKACDTCVRGAIAARDYKEGEIIAKVPLNISVDLGTHGFETYQRLAELVYVDAISKDTHKDFWNSQPSPNDVLAVDNMDAHMIDMLQSKRLQQVVATHQATLSSTYEEALEKLKSHGLTDSQLPTFDDFSYLAALVTSRAFMFTNPTLQEDHTYLIPAVDMINHELPANVERRQEGGDILVIATKDVKATEELTYAYDAEVIHRDDLSLLMYGFVKPRDDPLLSACDLIEFTEDDPWQSTPEHDSHPYNTDGTLDQASLHGEIARLQNLLDESGTGLEEDQALLADWNAGKGVPKAQGWGWKEAMVVQWRVQRKLALTNRINTLRENAAEL